MTKLFFTRDILQRFDKKCKGGSFKSKKSKKKLKKFLKTLPEFEFWGDFICVRKKSGGNKK